MATRERTVTLPRRAGDGDGVNLSGAERWISTIGGSALAAYGLKRRSLAGAAMEVAAVALMARGVTGHCPVNEAIGRDTAHRPCFDLKVEGVYTVNRPPEELYAWWKRLENLPAIMSHLKSVTDMGDGRSHWVARGPAGREIEWDAEIINDVPNETLAWKALDGSDIDHAGAVRFQPAPGGRGTEVHVTLEYNPPAGRAGALIARLFGEEPAQQVREDLRRFKQIMEAGSVPTIEGQPNGKYPGRQESLMYSFAHPSR